MAKRVIKIIPLPKKMLGSKIVNMESCTGPIPSVSISFENGYRLDIAVFGNPSKAHQIVSPEENPYYRP